MHSVRAGNRQSWSRLPPGSVGSATSNSAAAGVAQEQLRPFHRSSSGMNSRSILLAGEAGPGVSIRLRVGLAVVACQVQAQRLDQDRPFGQGPGSARVVLGLLVDALQAGQGDEPLHRRAVGPLGTAHLVGNCRRMRFVSRHRGEQAGLAQSPGERLRAAVLLRSTARGGRIRLPGR